MTKPMKSKKEPSIVPKRKIATTSLLIVLGIMLLLQGCDLKNENTKNTDIAVKKVSDLFEVEDEEKIKEGKTSQIKDSTNQKQIDEALKAVDTIDTDGDGHSEKDAIAFSLQSAILIAQLQLQEREGSLESSSPATQDEQKEEEFHPAKDDIVLKNNELKNKEQLEEFMKNAGENGENNESEIRVVKDERANGVLLYDLKSRYDKNANQRWIEVIPDLSHYNPPENEVQDVFNTPQQCSYMSKDRTEGYYKLNECRTHLEYRFLPIIDNK